MKLILLTDYKNCFYSSHRLKYTTMDIPLLKKYFSEHDVNLEIKKFHEINFSENYTNKFILYASSEDDNLYYKDYIEDVILGLSEKGAILIPEFKFFRAHHNKSFMEILRQSSSLDIIKSINCIVFGTYEEYIKNIKLLTKSIVLKVSAGARSKGVLLANNKREKIKYAKKISISPNFSGNIANIIKNYYKTKFIFELRKLKYFLIGAKALKLTPSSLHRKKFIVQNFIKNCNIDFKVLIYGKNIMCWLGKTERMILEPVVVEISLIQ